ncbi:MAG: hypothetical protein GEU93_02260 [Propionibacteriales bacterium]|nr:hypothetical protein [Propionibacteriales bacterium]
MNDIKQLLNEATRSVEAVPSAEVVEADVRRGRAALARARRRRTIRNSVIGMAATFALVGGSITVGGLGDSDRAAVPSDPRAGSSEATAKEPGTATGVRLVAYTGKQPDGFIVDRVPEGWFIQGSRAYSLTIAPEGDTSHPDGFVGKLVVMLLSRTGPQELPKNGEPVKVGDQDGVVVHQDASDTLTYRDGEGHIVQVQAWKTLGWTNDRLAGFAEGVQVTAHAKQGVG